MSLMKNLPTWWRKTEEENRWQLKKKRSSMKNFLTQWRVTEEENQRLMTEG